MPNPDNGKPENPGESDGGGKPNDPEKPPEKPDPGPKNPPSSPERRKVG